MPRSSIVDVAGASPSGSTDSDHLTAQEVVFDLACRRAGYRGMLENYEARIDMSPNLANSTT